MQEKGIEKRCSIYRMCLSGLCLIFICVGSVGMVLASENVTDAVELADRPGFTPQQIDIWVNEDGSVIINREISRSNDLDFLRSTIESKLSQSWKVQVNLESTAACPQQLVTGIKNILSDLGIIPDHKISPKLEFVQRGYRVSPVIEMKYLFTNALIYFQEDVFRAYYAEYPVDEDSADYPVTISARHFPGYTASIAISYGEDEIPDGMRVEKTPVGEKLVLAGAQDGLTELSVLINRDGVYVNNRLISDFKLETFQAVLFRELEARTYSSVVLNSSGLFRKNTVAEIEALFGEMKMPYENRSIRDQVPVDTRQFLLRKTNILILLVWM